MHDPPSLNTPAKALIAPYLQHFQNDILIQVASSHPNLTTLAQYYIQQPSKRLRPCLILLMSQATNGLGTEWHLQSTPKGKLQSEGRLALVDRDSDVSSQVLDNILPSQYLFAQIIEVVHVASLLHDDVIDQSETRRGAPSAPAIFGTCHTILGGDYLLGRIMIMGARLGSSEVMSLIGQIVCTLVEGEFLQDDNTELDPGPTVGGGRISPTTIHTANTSFPPADRHYSFNLKDPVLSSLWERYLLQTYMKTASLFSLALQCTVILGGAISNDPWREVAKSYGECLGMAFQLIDDLLDYEGEQSVLGKPANADLTLGLVTAPVFFALQEDDSIRQLVIRRFAQPGDMEKVVDSVKRTQALQRTRSLAECYARRAGEALSGLPDSAAKAALGDLAKAVLVRKN